MAQTELENNNLTEENAVLPETEATPEVPEADPFAQYDAPAEGPETQPYGEQPAEVLPATPAAFTEPSPENVLAGVVGAFLFALIGGVAYFLVYQMGYIAGICGLITVMLASFGYGLFSGRKNTTKGVIFSIVMTLVMIPLAEYFCLAFEFYNVFTVDYGINFFEALRALPSFMFSPEVMPELLPSVIGDIVIAYLLGALASFSNIRAVLKANKAAKAAREAQNIQR